MERAALDGENLSEKVTFKMSFELHNNEETKHPKQRDPRAMNLASSWNKVHGKKPSVVGAQ